MLIINTLSNDHRKNDSMNMNSENIKDKIIFIIILVLRKMDFNYLKIIKLIKMKIINIILQIIAKIMM